MNRHSIPSGGYQGYTGYEDPRKAKKEAMAQAMGRPASAGAAPNYDALDRDSAYYQSMLQTGMDYSPTNFTGGLARLANAFVGRQGLNRVEEREKEYAEQEAAAAQAQKDKFADMARMMAGPDADPQMAAMVEMFPEEFAKSRFEIDVNAAKPVTPQKPSYYETTVMENGKPMQYEFQHGNPDYKRLIGEAQPRSALVNNTFSPGGGVPFSDVPDGIPLSNDQLGGYKPSDGKVAVRDRSAPNGFREEMIEGGAAATAQAEADAKAATRRDYDARSGTTVLRDLNRGIGLLDTIYGEESRHLTETGIEFGLWSTMLPASKRQALAQVPGTAEYVFKRNIRSAKSNVGLDRLQGVRDFSPTGGALGQIPVQQQEKLEETIGALDDLGLPRPFVEENLRSANNDYLDIVYGSAAQRRLFVEQDIITEADNEWIESQYDSLGYDAYGNYMLGDPNYTQPVVGRTLPDGTVFTEEDLIATMEANDMSRLEVEAMVRASMR